MNNSDTKMFVDFPDVLTIADMKKALGVSNKMAYMLINNGAIKHFRMGKLIKIPKKYLIEFVEMQCYNLGAMGKLPCHLEGSNIL